LVAVCTAPVDIRAAEAPDQAHGDGLRGAGAHEAIKNQIVGVGGSLDHTFKELFWFLSGIA
jgi:hypothetical protein